MKLKELYSWRPLRTELRHLEQQRRHLTEGANSLTPILSGMPRNKKVTKKVESYGIRIHDVDVRIRETERRIREIEEFIASVEDDWVRTILERKIYDGYTYQQIAAQFGGGNTKDSIKMRTLRYFYRNAS